MPGQADARLEIVIVSCAQRAARMDDRSLAACDYRVGAVGVEIAHQSVLGGEGTFVRVTDAEICGDRRSDLPIILEIEAIDGRSRKPGGQFGVKLRLPHRTE